MAPHQLDEEPLQPNASASGAGNNLVLVSDVLPDRLTILPLRDRPIFPGLTLPIGGVREKTIAARRVGITEIILPEENRKDFEELPPYIRDGMTVHYADHFDDIVGMGFGNSKQ